MGNKPVIKLEQKYQYSVILAQNIDISQFPMSACLTGTQMTHDHMDKHMNLLQKHKSLVNFQPLTLSVIISQFLQDLYLSYHQYAQYSQSDHEFIKINVSSACWFVLSSVWLFVLLPQQQVDS